MNRQNLKMIRTGTGRGSRPPFLTLSVCGHPSVVKLKITPSALGAVVSIKTKNGTTRSRLLSFYYPRDPADFRYSAGNFFIDVRPHRGHQRLRLYWHSFRGGRDLSLTGDISGETLTALQSN